MGDEDGAYCENCNTAIAGGMLLDLCDQHAEFTAQDKKDGVTCKTLKKDFEKGKISAGKLLCEIRARVTDKEHLKQLDNIRLVAKDNGINLGD